MKTKANLSLDSSTFLVGILAVTATILFVGLLVVGNSPAPAFASEVGSLGTDFSVTVGQVTRDTEVLYVVDNVTQRMMVYQIDRKNGTIIIQDKAELGSGTATPPARSNPRGRP